MFVDEFNPRPPVRLDREPYIWPTARIRNCRLGEYTEIGEFCEMIDSSMDDYSYVSAHSAIIYSILGKFVNIASSVRLNPGFHPMERPSQHHFTYRPQRYGFAENDDKSFFHWRSIQRVQVGHDAWLGHGCTVMPGVRIGNGAVVGSGSVVTRDVPAYGIVGGVPAKIIRYRFNRDIGEALDRIAWWDWPHELIRERLKDFSDLRAFICRYDPQTGDDMIAGGGL